MSTYSAGGITYTLSEEGGVCTASASWDGTSSEVTVEASVSQNEKTYIVNELKAFGRNTTVTKVTIKPNDHLTLAKGTLQKSSNLQTIDLGDGITSLPQNFAASNLKLTTVNLSNVTTIGAAAFGGCIGLTAVDLSNTIAIGDQAFNGCSNLTSVDLSKVTEIGKSAFQNCTALEKVSFSQDLEIVGSTVFKSCTGLQSISLPGNILTIGTGMFQGCKGLSSINFDPNFKNIGVSMFEGCTSLTSIDLKNVQSINASAFRSCTGLTSVIIPNSVKAIGNMAFDGCTSLATCNLSTSLESLGSLVFQNCPLITGKMIIPKTLVSISLHQTGVPTFPVNLSEIEVEEGNTSFASKDGILYDRDLKTVLYCPGAKTGEVIISASVGTYAFAGCHLSRITVLTGAETIGNVAFGADTENPTLEELVLPDTLESIGHNIVSGQTKLKAIVLPSKLDSLGSIFRGLTGLEYVAFPNTVFVAPLANSFNGATFHYSDGTTVPANAANDTISSLQGLRFVWDGSTTGNYYQITDSQVLLITNIDGVVSYQAIQKGVPYDGVPVASEGTKFAGWFTDSLMSVAYSNMDAVTADLTLYAKFIPETHTVTYKVDGEVVGEAKTYDYGTELSVNNVYEKIGYTVSDWSCTGATLVDGKITIKGEDVVFTATSTVNQYTITFDTAGGSAIAAITQDYDSDVTAPEAPTRTGYTFAGWSAEVPAKMPVDGMTITASWTINQYTITFDTAGGSAIAAITQDYDSDVTAPEAPTRTGYTFAGWSAEVPAKMPVDGMTITASWTINQYTITFDTAGGSAIAAITQDYNTSVTAPAVEPSRDGYRFVKWDSEIPASMPADDVIIKAVWAIVATVGENGKSVVTLDSETSSFIPAAETKEITVEIRENTAVKVENASDLIGKTVVSKVEPVSNSTGVSGTAYEFTFTADGTQYNGKIQVTLPYTKEDGKEPVVYYWNGSESTKMNVVSSTDASVTFETDHNSMYVVASETPSKDDGASFLLYFGILIVAGICAAVLIGFNFYHKKA
ncbi:MAG: leucine-rich repeat protein [Methanomethylophilus alvi]